MTLTNGENSVSVLIHTLDYWTPSSLLPPTGTNY